MIVDHDQAFDIEQKIIQNNQIADDEENLNEDQSQQSEDHSSISIQYADNSFKYRYNLFKFLGVLLLAILIVLGVVQIFNMKNVKTLNKENVRNFIDNADEQRNQNHMKIKQPADHEGKNEETSVNNPNQEIKTEVSNKDKNEEQQAKPQKPQKNTESNPQKLTVKYDDGTVVTGYAKPEVYTLSSDEPLQKPRKLLEIQDIPEIDKHLKKIKDGVFSDEGKLAKNTTNLAYQFFRHPNNEMTIKAQYLYFDREYNIGKYKKQLPMCIVAAGRNMLRHELYKEFLYSIERQNYTNFKLIIVDDQSTDETYPVFKKILSESQLLKDRFILIHNPENIGSLGNKDFMIRNHCKSGDIVIDVDADDSLIGRQAFNVINALYQSTKNWFIYSNNLFRRPTKKNHQSGLCKNINTEDWKKNSYRTSKSWVTSELRSYYRDLYVKIPKSHLFKNQTHYYLWAADRYVMYPIIELAGSKHTKFIPDLLYYYNINPRRPPCIIAKIKYDEYTARKQTPLLPIQSLEEKAKVTKNYKIPQRVIEVFQQVAHNYTICKQNGEYDPKLI